MQPSCLYLYLLIGLDEDELQVIKKWAYNLRVAMIVVSTLCVITSWYNLATASNSIANNFLAVYVFFFSMIVCCYEVAIRQVTFIIVQNFGFMYNPVGRSIFLIFVAILLFQLSTMGQVMFMC
jgi:COPI associated protein